MMVLFCQEARSSSSLARAHVIGPSFELTICNITHASAFGKRILLKGPKEKIWQILILLASWVLNFLPVSKDSK